MTKFFDQIFVHDFFLISNQDPRKTVANIVCTFRRSVWTDHRNVLAQHPELNLEDYKMDPKYELDSVSYVDNMRSPRFIQTHLPFKLLPEELQNNSTSAKVKLKYLKNSNVLMIDARTLSSTQEFALEPLRNQFLKFSPGDKFITHWSDYYLCTPRYQVSILELGNFRLPSSSLE